MPFVVRRTFATIRSNLEAYVFFCDDCVNQSLLCFCLSSKSYCYLELGMTFLDSLAHQLVGL
ncbi:41816_t:CDS:2 [Gigaspora margarita]|uniref:41816_t:CDS:1 n=1 Tax=Gigaspora margarita TaxID=4874 RepID=A0ABN7UXS1_GIGMA|nr:41816_t:CDS:2 [Gigaspora margarita]